MAKTRSGKKKMATPSQAPAGAAVFARDADGDVVTKPAGELLPKASVATVAPSTPLSGPTEAAAAFDALKAKIAADPPLSLDRRVEALAVSEELAPPREDAAAPIAPVASTRAETSRLRRLRRAGVSIDRCPILDIGLDVGPRSAPRARPAEIVIDGGFVTMSTAAVDIFYTGASPDELERAAAWLREREERGD
jgi:hypothetical protein